MMTTSTFDFGTFTSDVAQSLPFDEGMVLYIPRIYPLQRGAVMDEAETQRRIEMELLEQDLGEVLRVDLQCKEPRPAERFFQAFVHLRWHDTAENRLLQLELRRANTLDPNGRKCGAPKLEVQGGFWMMMPRSAEAAWRSNSHSMGTKRDADAPTPNLGAVLSAPVTTALTPTPPPSPASGSPNPCRRYVSARGRSGGSPVQEYVRDAGVADPHAVAEQCRRMGGKFGRPSRDGRSIGCRVGDCDRVRMLSG